MYLEIPLNKDSNLYNISYVKTIGHNKNCNCFHKENSILLCFLRESKKTTTATQPYYYVLCLVYTVDMLLFKLLNMYSYLSYIEYFIE